MKKIYYFLFSFIFLFSLIIIHDSLLFFTSYNELVLFQDTVCKMISLDGGISNNVKKLVYENNMFLEYEKSSDVNGATYEFSLCKNVDYILSIEEKYIKINLVVILGY